MTWHHGLDSGGCPVDHDGYEPEPEAPVTAKPISFRVTPDQHRLLKLARDQGGVTKGELHSADWRRLDALVGRRLMSLVLDRRNTHLVTEAGIEALRRAA